MGQIYEIVSTIGAVLATGLLGYIMVKAISGSIYCTKIFEILPYLKIIKYFLKKGVNINDYDKKGLTKGLAPLHTAVLYSNIKLVEYLVQNGANINAKDKYGYTPLMLAKHGNREDIVRYLETELLIARKNNL